MFNAQQTDALAKLELALADVQEAGVVLVGLSTHIRAFDMDAFDKISGQYNSHTAYQMLSGKRQVYEVKDSGAYECAFEE